MPFAVPAFRNAARHPRAMAAKKFPILPKHPERICWGCDLYCASTELRCGNGSERTQHPMEIFGDDWAEWGLDAEQAAESATETAEAPTANELSKP